MATNRTKGGNGGTNGGNGGHRTSVSSNADAVGGAGGANGGGDGGLAVTGESATITEANNGKNGTDFGDGGGGAGAFYDSDDKNSYNSGKGGTGYQGCVMVRIKLNDEGLPPFTSFTFTIAGTSYTADPGMTWVAWCSSLYNTIGLSTAADGTGRVFLNVSTSLKLSGASVYGRDAIVEGGAYTM